MTETIKQRPRERKPGERNEATIKAIEELLEDASEETLAFIYIFLLRS